MNEAAALELHTAAQRRQEEGRHDEAIEGFFSVLGHFEDEPLEVANIL